MSFDHIHFDFVASFRQKFIGSEQKLVVAMKTVNFLELV